MRRNFLYMGTQQCVNVPAGQKQKLGGDIAFMHAVVGPGLSKNVTKPTMQ